MLFNNTRKKGHVVHLHYGTAAKARQTLKYLRKKSPGEQIRSAQSMYYRAKYHAKQTPDMREAMKVYSNFLGKYHPKRYYQGLSAKKKTQRKKEIQKYGSMSWKNQKAYVGFKTNRGIRTKSSKYTTTWKSKFPNATSLEDKSKATGVPLKYIKESYNRGMAAWRTGHRPGATEQQWGYARVHSFLLCGKTYHSTDSDLAREAKKHSNSARHWWSSQKC